MGERPLGDLLFGDFILLSGLEAFRERVGERLGGDLIFLSGLDAFRDRVGERLGDRDFIFLSGINPFKDRLGDRLGDRFGDFIFLSGNPFIDLVGDRPLGDRLLIFRGCIWRSWACFSSSTCMIRWLGTQKTREARFLALARWLTCSFCSLIVSGWRFSSCSGCWDCSLAFLFPLLLVLLSLVVAAALFSGSSTCSCCSSEALGTSSEEDSLHWTKFLEGFMIHSISRKRRGTCVVLGGGFASCCRRWLLVAVD